MSGAEPPRVAFQGLGGAFSEEAIRAGFGADGAVPLPRRDFEAVGNAVLEGEAELGLLPVENSIAGSVTGAFDVLARGRLVVLGEVILPIRHCLLGVGGARIEYVRRVISHPVALAQCMRFLSTLESAEIVATWDTAGAAQEVAARGEREVAAVAAQGAAERYGLDVLAEGIEDRTDNQTRFLVVGEAGASETVAVGVGERTGARSCGLLRGVRRKGGADDREDDAPAAARKTLLLLETEHRAGALSDALVPFAAAGISLAHIVARPADEPWHYRFFLELDVDASTPAAAAAIAAARARAYDLRVLGSFDGAARPGGRKSRTGV
jgi:prephenate dehydratase